jgi:hypothetical protein
MTNRYINTSSYNLIKEYDRLKTFKDNGFSNSSVNIEEAARCGLYYYRGDDIIKCQFCNIIIGKFIGHGSVSKIHKQVSENCPLLLNRYNENLPIRDDHYDGESRCPDMCGAM